MKESEIRKKKFRYERKFVVPYLNKKETEQVISDNSGLFREIYYERQNNNIYFDSLDMTSYFDNVLGNANRTKIRIRWYGDLENAENPILELKIKRGLVGTKLSFPLKPFSLPVTLDEIQENFRTSNLPNWLLETLKVQRFSLINHYKRKYFLSACGKFRLTLDSDLSYHGLFNQTNLSLMHKMEEDHLIVELKYDVSENPERIATEFPFRMTKSSKFVSGVTFFRGE